MSEVRFTFDGEQMRAEDGQTIAAALMADGITSWRTTRFGGSPRGILCGIGVCYDCLLTLNGEPNVRACVTQVQPGDDVRRQDGVGVGELRADSALGGHISPQGHQDGVGR
jgi:predicted molibdopterin-dependent oxidoreductase YjgC